MASGGRRPELLGLALEQLQLARQRRELLELALHEFECRRPARSVLQQADPDANRQVLEDRASLVFWKWVAAVGTRRLETFERLCAPEVNQQLCALPPRISGIEHCAVGGVDLVRIEVAAERQCALFLLRWSTSGAGSGIVRTNALALTRAAHVRTNPRLGLSTDRCHHCGAPQNELDAVRCGHCQALLTQDWSFEELGEPEGLNAAAAAGGSAAEERPTAALADPHERRRVLAALVAIARADGEVSAREWELLEGCAQRWSIERGYLDGPFAAPVDQLLDLRPRNPEAAQLVRSALRRGLGRREDRRERGGACWRWRRRACESRRWLASSSSERPRTAESRHDGSALLSRRRGAEGARGCSRSSRAGTPRALSEPSPSTRCPKFVPGWTSPKA